MQNSKKWRGAGAPLIALLAAGCGGAFSDAAECARHLEGQVIYLTCMTDPKCRMTPEDYGDKRYIDRLVARCEREGHIRPMGTS